MLNQSFPFPDSCINGKTSLALYLLSYGRIDVLIDVKKVVAHQENAMSFCVETVKIMNRSGVSQIFGLPSNSIVILSRLDYQIHSRMMLR